MKEIQEILRNFCKKHENILSQSIFKVRKLYDLATIENIHEIFVLIREIDEGLFENFVI